MNIIKSKKYKIIIISSLIAIIILGVIVFLIENKSKFKKSILNDCAIEVQNRAEQKNLTTEESDVIKYSCYGATASLHNDKSICELIPTSSPDLEKIYIDCYAQIASMLNRNNLKVCDSLKGNLVFGKSSKKEACLNSVMSYCCSSWKTIIKESERPVCKSLRQREGYIFSDINDAIKNCLK